MESISLVSSSAIPTTRGDRLLVRLSTRFEGPIDVDLQIQFEESNGTVNYTNQIVSVPASTRQSELAIPLTDGRLLRVAASRPGTTDPPGYVYIQLAVLRGNVIQNPNILYLNNGYITSGNAVLYPPDLSPGSLQIDMMPLAEAPTGSGPGAGIALTVLGANFGEFTFGAFTFTADANAANRTIRVRLSDANGIQCTLLGRTVITANEERIINLWRGPNIPDDNTTSHYIPLPELLWLSDPAIAISAINIQAGDDWTNPFVWFRCNKISAF